MADWFQIDSNLPQKPEVRQIRRSTREEKSTIVGRLVMFWALVDQHGDLLDEHERPDGTDFDGLIPGYTIEDLEDEIGGDRDFWESVSNTGWLREDSRGVLVPGFDRRFETNAKRRAEASRRKRRQRNRETGVTGTSTKTSRKAAETPEELPDDRRRVTNVTTSRDKSVTRGEERRREERTEEEIPSPSADLTSAPCSEPKRKQRRGNEEGKVLFWRELTAKPELLQRAVKARSSTFFEQAWSEASQAGWVTQGDRETRRRFLAACFFACHPPPEFQVDNPAALVRHKLIERDWKTGRMDGADDDWGRAMERLLDGVATQPRTARLDATQREQDEELDRRRESFIKQLKASAGT